VVRLGVAGDPDLPWLAELDGVAMLRPGRDYSELQVAAGRDPGSILQAALARGESVTRFEIGDPTIEDVFIERVGAVDREERTLAAVPQVRPS
jgi:ABC-type uncharacterized transport system ATPase subunit